MKKISRRTFLNVMGAAGAAGALAACGGSSSGSSAAGASSAAAGGASAAAGGDVTIRITWWGGQSRHEYTQQLLDKYTELNPSVHFQATPSGWDGYFEKLATDTATGGMADIVQMDYMYISTYAKNGSLADLSSYSSDGTLDTSTIDEALLGSGTIDGKLVGIPLASTLLAFIYNPSVLEEAGVEPPQNGWTWDDFKSICLTVKETTGKYGFGGSAFIDTNLLNYWVRQYGVPLFAADNKSLGFDDQQILTDYFQLWKDLIDAGAAPNPDEYEQIATLGNEASPVITGDAAFHQSWDNFANIGANAGNDTLELLVPPVKEAGQAALWYKPGMFFSVAETSEVKEECAKFIDWFVNSDEANDIIMGERGTPRLQLGPRLSGRFGQAERQAGGDVQLCHRGRRLLRRNPRPRSHRHLRDQHLFQGHRLQRFLWAGRAGHPGRGCRHLLRAGKQRPGRQQLIFCTGRERPSPFSSKL